MPGKEYSFEIEAKAGRKVSDRASITANTPVPALSAARVLAISTSSWLQRTASQFRMRELAGRLDADRFALRLIRPRCDGQTTALAEAVTARAGLARFLA